MINTKFLKWGTFGLAATLVGIVAKESIPESTLKSSPLGVLIAKSGNSESNRADDDAPRPILEMGRFGVPARPGSNDESNAAEPTIPKATNLTLKVGRIGTATHYDQLPTVSDIPTTGSDARRLYRQAKVGVCNMVLEGLPVQRKLSPVEDGVAGIVGRVPALTIGLELDEAGRDKLPTVVCAQVQQYLGKHRLSVQPMIYHDETGQCFFGSECQAAFYELDRPGLTVRAEPMIETAVSRFRMLGALRSETPRPTSRESQARTVAMGFTFERQTELVSGAVGKQNAIEWLFLHLPPDATPENPNIQVFVTKNDRQEIHLLNTQDSGVTSPLATISATVRFDKMVLMGVYPSEPVVNRIDFRSQAVMPTHAMRKLKSIGDETLTWTEVLDQFGELRSPDVEAGIPLSNTADAFQQRGDDSREPLQRRFDSTL
ncbi:MAG: hypothetical protein AAF539_02935 [Planctomycetota bacterium]